MTETLANWNGDEMPLSDVKVSVLDRAFLFGDAVYEVIRVYSGRAWKADEHFERLSASLSAVELGGVDQGRLRRRMEETLARSGVLEGLVYIQVTRGAARRTHHYPASAKPNELVYVEEFANPYAAMRANGCSAITYPDIRWSKNYIKATSMLANCMAAQAAVAARATESILVDGQGYVSEGSHTSIFAVRQGELLVSPDGPNVLPGITKKQILTLAQQKGVPVRSHRLKKDELLSVDELFLSGTPEEILAITQLDGHNIASGLPGPVTAALYDAFAESLRLWLSSAAVS